MASSAARLFMVSLLMAEDATQLFDTGIGDTNKQFLDLAFFGKGAVFPLPSTHAGHMHTPFWLIFFWPAFLALKASGSATP